MSDIAEMPPVEEKLIDIHCQPVTLFPDCVAMSLGSGKAEIEKKISYEDFLTIIRTSIGKKNEEVLEGFSMPSNCFYFAHTGMAMQVSCYYSERVVKLDYTGSTKKLDIKIPNIIISHCLDRRANTKNWQIITSKYFCTDLKVSKLPPGFVGSVNHSGRVFLLPFTNTYEDGKMCYGGNSMPPIMYENNLRGLDWYYEYLFSSKFNDDLGVKALATSMAPKPWYELLKKTADKKEDFPYDKLRGFTPIQVG